MAVPFDQDRLEVTGSAVPIVQGIAPPGAYGDTEITLSASGTLWYSAGSATSNVEPVWVTRNGVATRIHDGWSGNINYPALSPDGARVAYSVDNGGSTELWLKELDRGAPVIFAREGTVNFRPSWSPSGRNVAWVSDRGTNYEMFMKPADQSRPPEKLLPAFPTGPVWELNFASTGSWLAYRIEARGSDIYAIRPGVDSVPVEVSATGASERMPAVSPDGRWIAYVSDVTGRYEIFVRPFPNVESAVWQVSTNGGTQPRWSRSGRELFYVRGASEFVSVAVGSGTAFSWGDAQVLFSMSPYRRPINGRSYDIAPGDQRFFMLRIVPDSSTGGVIVVENFFEELRAKVPR
jgi:serine/threonine-protein kinase